MKKKAKIRALTHKEAIEISSYINKQFVVWPNADDNKKISISHAFNLLFYGREWKVKDKEIFEALLRQRVGHILHEDDKGETAPCKVSFPFRSF